MEGEAESPPERLDPSEVADQGPFPAVEGVLDRALAMVEYLRAHCPWDARQTARTLVPHLLEEAHETVDAIHADDAEALRGELGDLLLNLAFQVVVAEESRRFTREEIVRTLEEKMIRRHPHLFGQGEKEPWETIKARERAARRARTDAAASRSDGSEGAAVPPHPVLEGLSRGLGPLLRAHRMQEKVAGVGFDWAEASGALEKVREELDEVEAELASGDTDALAEEMGDLLFSVVNLARLAGTHAAPALELANSKFRARFEALERLAHDREVALPGASLDELDALWDDVKVEERRSRAASEPSDGDPGPPGEV